MEFLLPQILIYVNIRQICDQQKLFMCIKKPLVREQSMTNQFSTNVLLLYTLKISYPVFWCFQGIYKWNIGWKWLNCPTVRSTGKVSLCRVFQLWLFYKTNRKVFLTEHVGSRRQRCYFNNDINCFFMMKLNLQIKKVVKNQGQLSGLKYTPS